MRVVVISTQAEPQERLETARQQGYITFIYHHADPFGDFVQSRFLHVHSDTELKEKINLLSADPTLIDEVRRLS